MDGLDSTQVLCAVSGDFVDRANVIEVGLFFEDGSSQCLYITKKIIDQILHDSIPRHPDLIDT